MESRLEVSVGANISELSKNLAKGQKDISSFSTNASKELSKLDAVSKSGGQTLDKFSKSSNSAGFALTNLGRVAQDAPFGFIGIQNNLNPLLESFAQLRKESGSNAAALKALGGSLIGPAGIGIALSVVSAGILLYQEYVRKSNKATQEAAKSTQEYRDTLTGLNKTIFEGQTAGGEELSKLDLLFRSSRDLTLSLKDRQLAVNELQKQYPNYFANLTTENALTEKSSGLYKLLRQQIVATSLARAADKDTAKQGEVIFENLAKRTEAQKQINKLEGENARIRQDLTPANAQFNAQQSATNEKSIISLTKETKAYDLSLKNANTQIFNNSQLQDAIVRKFGVQAIVADEAGKAVNKLASSYSRLNTETVKIGVEDNGEAITNSVKPIVQKLADSFKSGESLVVSVPLKFNLVAPNITSEFDLLFQKLSESTLDFEKNIVPVISDSFSAIGQAFASGDYSQIGRPLLDALAGFIGELGKLLITQGKVNIAAGIAQNIIAPGSGVNRIVGGAALIAAGALAGIAGGAVKGAGQGSNKQGGYKIPGFATGVSNFGGGMALVGERGPELVTLGRGSNVITNENISKYGKSNSMPNIILQEAVIRGQDIIIVQKRAQTKLSKVI